MRVLDRKTLEIDHGFQAAPESKPGKPVRLTHLGSWSLEAAEEQTDLVRVEEEVCKHVDVGWDFLKGAVSSNDKVWAVTVRAALAAPSSPITLFREPCKQTVFVYGHNLDYKLKVLYNHQVLEFYCEGMLGRWLQSYT